MTNTNFILKIKNTTTKYLNLIYQSTQIRNNENTTRQLTIQLNQELQEQLEQETNYIQYDGIIRQRFLNHLAGDLAITDQRRDWFLYKALTIIISTEEFDNLLKKIYKTQYTPLKNRIYQIGTILEELKYHYDMMENNPKDTQKYKYHNTEVTKRLIKLPLINDELNTLLHIVSTKTNLGQYTVPQQAISKVAQEYKKADIVEERKIRPEPERPE